MTTVSSLVAALETVTVIGSPEGMTTAICQDSRYLLPGGTFVAVPGGRVDGHDFLPQAVAAGSRVLVVQDDHHERWRPLRDSGVTLLCVPDTRRALGRLAAAFYGYPARRLHVVGITGTDGKTTTTFFTDGVLAAGGVATAFLSTAGARIGDRLTPNHGHLTTPDAVEVQRFLANALAAGASCAILESTSQGLHQGRLAQVEFDVAVLTNLAEDHLDYHGSKEAYLLAKALLFDLLDRAGGTDIGKTAVVNADCLDSQLLAARTSARRLPYGISGGEVTAAGVTELDWGSSYRLRAGGRGADVRLALPGRFNVYNSLAAAAVGVAFGLDLDQIARGLASVTQVPGRMQRIDAGQPCSVIVDYAHNAHELRQALSYLRRSCSGRLVTVFGCAGNRDPRRRPEMGRVAGQLADYTVVTSEDAWHEEPETIMAEIVDGLVAAGKQPGRDYTSRVDRREAIELALSMAGAGDVVLVAGMGHEQSMVVAGRAQPWDDRAVIRELLAGPAGRAGPVARPA